MFVFGCDDIRGVDGILFIIVIGLIIWFYVEVKFFVGSIGDDVVFVYLFVVVGGIVVFY